jgi:hypothetical protein
MYRLRISRWEEDYLRVSSKHHKEAKLVKVKGVNESVIAYALSKACLELHRDILYSKFPDSYRQVEMKYKELLNDSVFSAVKRARNNG